MNTFHAPSGQPRQAGAQTQKMSAAEGFLLGMGAGLLLAGGLYVAAALL